jgi:hypothetical protein
MHPQIRADQYVLDTQTGKMWQVTVDKKGNIIFNPALYDCYNNDGTYSGRFANPR